MSRAGDVYENPVTGERVMVGVGNEGSGGELSISDFYLSPGGAVAGEHLHPNIEERFTVVRGWVGFRVDGRESVAPIGETLRVPSAVARDWWNAGEEEAHVVVELRREAATPARFEMMISTLFGLARDGKADTKGRPSILQAALFAREFDDIIRFVKPPRLVQTFLLGALAPVARLLGYRAIYPEYTEHGPTSFTEVELWPGYVQASNGRRPFS
jgi:hypothetical protein